MVVITLKTSSDGKVGYHFCQETVASALHQFSGGLENKPAMFICGRGFELPGLGLRCSKSILCTDNHSLF